MKIRNYTQLHNIFGADLMISDINFRFEYLNMMEKSFQSHKLNLSNYFSDVVNQYNDPFNLTNFKPTFGITSILCEQQYENNFREGQFFQLYAYLEDTLMMGCQRCIEYFCLSHGIEELHGNSNINAIKLFLEKSLLIDHTKLDAEWVFIENLRYLRNFLVSRNRFGKNHFPSNDMDRLIAFSNERFTVRNNIDGVGPNIYFSNSYFFYEILTTLENLLYKIGEYDLPETDPRSIADQLGYIK